MHLPNNKKPKYSHFFKKQLLSRARWPLVVSSTLSESGRRGASCRRGDIRHWKYINEACFPGTGHFPFCIDLVLILQILNSICKLRLTLLQYGRRLRIYPWRITRIVVAGHPTIDPLWQNDTIPPYPSLKDPSTQNILGTRLFGWKGCTVRESQDIAEAYDDFYTLAQQDGVAKNIDWASPAALEVWGPSKGKYVIQDSKRAEIQRKSDSSLLPVVG
jgi:hypothetical protein